MKMICILLIRFYRLAISPLLGNCCKFYPSCSEYALLALEKYGTGKSLLLIIKRIGKCGPYGKGGIDFP